MWVRFTADFDWKPKPQDVAQPNRDQWGGLFAKRREILTDSWVTVHRLA